MPELYKDYLNKQLREKKKHDVLLAMDVLPFLSKRTRALRGRFNKVLGEYIRKICDLELDSSALKSHEFFMSEEQNVFSEHIARSVEFDSDEEQYDFIRFLDQYLFNKEDIKLIHPFLFNLITVDKQNKNEFNKYGQFMKDTMLLNKEEVKGIFNQKESEDILTELILSQLDLLKDSPAKKREYKPLLKPLANLYQEDIIYLSKYKDYFLTSFPLLTHFYVFMYANQLVFKFEQYNEANYNELQPLYFSLEWESLSKRRKSASGDIDSFKYIKAKLDNLFPHIHTMSQLSHNAANVSENEIKNEETIDLLTYTEIYNLIQQGKLDERRFLVELKEWIHEYMAWRGNEYNSSSTTIREAFEELHDCLKLGMSSTVISKYGGNVEDLGANQFIKNRGSLGQVLNIKHDFLLLITAVSVKNERIPLNDLFIEFEKRGIALDRYSKKEVIKLFDKQNILDKKSDSGDAQYVKPIL
ncbi:hypothetical protein GCM10008986_33510 [Salinibacillus aidingensis]|uniref:DNA phosphorothioation-dependent restriction protein DptG n=1 Tax=Salinibacillus aidingensis TaxID=237684 RepID=A0ABN1BQB2_9BACI